MMKYQAVLLSETIHIYEFRIMEMQIKFLMDKQLYFSSI